MNINKKKRFFCWFILIYLIGTTAIVSGETLTDFKGKKIEKTGNFKRIISLSPSTTEVLFGLGLGSQVAGVTSQCNYPPEAQSKPIVGDMYLDYEKIVDIKPDLVVVELSLRPEVPAKLDRLNINYMCIDSSDYEKFERSVILIGKVTGVENNAVSIVNKMKVIMNEIKNKFKNLKREEHPRIFVEIWDKPLMTAGGDTFISYLVENAGGINICGDLKGFPVLNPETLLVRDPHLVILTTSREEDFLNNPIWRNIKAVKDKRVHYINPDIFVRPTLRLPQGCATLYRWFYPNENFDR